MNRSKHRVLVVEDDELLGRAYERLLGDDYEIVLVGNGDDAIAEMRAGRFHAVVSDIDVPGPSGIELLKTLRQSNASVPVVLVTGRPSIESAQDAVNYGAFRYLTKPVEPAALRDAVARAARLARLAELHLGSRVAAAHDDAEIRDLEARFERALDGIWIAFQPIVSCRARRTVGYEALLRTTEPSLMRPPDFLDAAEMLGRLGDLGRRVREKIGQLIASAPDDAKIFVNLHARDLIDPDLVNEPSLRPYAGRIVLEVTERASLHGHEDVLARATALRSAGFALAIDDLGAGYAGLSSLTQIDPEVVKLDMSLVRGIDQHRAKRQLVQSMVNVCIELGMSVVAEGVETPEERDALLGLGCDWLQGYLFARPSREFVRPCIA